MSTSPQPPDAAVERVLPTPAALALLERLRAEHVRPRRPRRRGSRCTRLRTAAHRLVDRMVDARGRVERPSHPCYLALTGTSRARKERSAPTVMGSAPRTMNTVSPATRIHSSLWNVPLIE